MSGWTYLIVAGQIVDLLGVGIIAFYTFLPAYDIWKRYRSFGMPDVGHAGIDLSWLPTPAEIRGIAAASLWGFGLMGIGFLAQALGTVMVAAAR